MDRSKVAKENSNYSALRSLDSEIKALNGELRIFVCAKSSNIAVTLPGYHHNSKADNLETVAAIALIDFKHWESKNG